MTRSASLYAWPSRPRMYGPTENVTGGHAVVLSWHVAPDFGIMPGLDRMLAIWAEPLLDQLVRCCERTTLLLAVDGEWLTPTAETALAQALAPRGIGLALAREHGPVSLALAVDNALAALSPDFVHAPERRGLLLSALARRAAGLAHLDTRFTLHARGQNQFQFEEQARFIADPEALVVDEMERQAMRHADVLRTSSLELAVTRPDIDLVPPLVWVLPKLAPATPCELVFPMPLGSEAGLEFAVSVLLRAAARQRFPLPVSFLAQPDAVTIGSSAQAVGRLAELGDRLDWRLLTLETPQQACRYLAQPGRVALFTAARATPQEWLTFCGEAGIPVIATTNRDTLAAAAYWPGVVHAVPRAERSVAALLARLPVMPSTAALAAPPRLPSPPTRPFYKLAAASLDTPYTPDLTVFCSARPALLASLALQSLDCFATTILSGEAIPVPARPAARPVRLLPHDVSLASALADCATRYAVLCGESRVLRPDALRALRHAAQVSNGAAITAWDSASQPLGGGADLALLKPGMVLGHIVLLDLPALRARGGRSLAVAGEERFAGQLAEESEGILVVTEVLAEATAPPGLPLPPPWHGLPKRLAGVPAMALHYAARQVPVSPMAGANRDSAHYWKLAARFFDSAGQQDAAADAWAALLAREPNDGETWRRHLFHSLRRHGRLAETEALAAFIAKHGIGALGEYPMELARDATAMAREGLGERALSWLLPLATILHEAPGFVPALALAHASCPPAARAVLDWPELPAPAERALNLALAEHGLGPEVKAR